MKHDDTRSATPTQPVYATISELELAHEILDRISTTAARALLVLYGYENGSRGHCRAKVATIAGKLEKSERTVQRALRALRELGLWDRLERRMRWSSRILTDLGRLVASILLGREPEIVADAPIVSGQVSPHNGEADPTPEEIPESSSPKARAPMGIVNPLEYAPRVGGSLHPSTWRELGGWMQSTGAATSFARCKIAHRAFSSFANGLAETREFRVFHRLRGSKRPFSAEYLVALAIQDARRSGADFGTVESALAYVGAIVTECVAQKRFPRNSLPAKALA